MSFAPMSSAGSSSSSPAHSPGLTARRRRLDRPEGTQQQPTLDPDNDDYDPKKRPGHPGDPLRRPSNALHRLESFFGVDATRPIDPTAYASTSPSSAPKHQQQGAPGTRLVLQHTVTMTDTLQGLALRYKTDVPTLRRVNGLWPGDNVLSRKILWVPLDKCKEMGMKSDVKLGLQGSDGNIVEASSSMRAGLELFDGVGSQNSGTSTPGSSSQPALTGTRRAPRDLDGDTAPSVSSISELSEPLSSASAVGSSAPVVRRLPSEVLGHFPAASRAEVLAKGKAKAADEWDQELTSVRPDYKLGPGPGMSGYEPGANGVEDLLQLAREARSKGDVDETHPTASKKATDDLDTVSRSLQLPHNVSTNNERRKDTSMVGDAVGSSASAAASSDPAWKPNVWKVGAASSAKEDISRSSMDSNRSGRPLASNSSATTEASSSLRPLKLVERSIEEWQASSSNLGPASLKPATEVTPSTYDGWNDIPSLEAYSKGRVVEAYSKGNKKRAARAHHRFMDDLAAGLPANAGPASKWARPIGESVPMPKAGGSSTAVSSSSGRPETKGNSLRSIFNDTLRGRIALDEALSKGFEEVLNRSEAWNTLPEEELEHARRVGAWPRTNGTHPTPGPPLARAARAPARISAEEARKSLGRNGGSRIAGSAFNGNGVVQGSPGLSPPLISDDSTDPSGSFGRRRSQHEMGNLQASRRHEYQQASTEASASPHLAPPGRPLLRKKSSTASTVGAPESQSGEGKWGW